MQNNAVNASIRLNKINQMKKKKRQKKKKKKNHWKEDFSALIQKK